MSLTGQVAVLLAATVIAVPLFRRLKLIAGFGRFGQIVVRVLRARHIRFTALEISQAQVDFLRRCGNRLHYGDASRLEMLRSAGAGQAEVLVLAIDDVEASVRTAELVRRHFPRLRILARAHDEETLRAQAAVKDDETKLIASARESARQLKSLFESDAR